MVAQENALALWLGAPPTSTICAAVAANLANAIEHMISLTVNMSSSSASSSLCPIESPDTGSDDCINFVGGVGVTYLFEALAQNGHADTALRLALKTSFPSFGYMFYNELEPSTTLWELWSSDIGGPTMDSRNHIYSASISTFLFKFLGGIRVVEPGYSRALIAPFVQLESGDNSSQDIAVLSRDRSQQIPHLRSVQATVGTPHGPLTSYWSTQIEPPPLPPPPPPQPPPPPPLPNATSCAQGQVVTTCAMKEEGNCPTCGHVCVGCPGGQHINAVPFASFDSAAPGVSPKNSSCNNGTALHPGKCPGGTARNPGCPNATQIVEKMCLGKQNCSVPVDFEIFGDTCSGKKILVVKVGCGSGVGSAGEQQRHHQHQGGVRKREQEAKAPVVYRHTVVVPVGSQVDVVVPLLLGQTSNTATITEGGTTIWSQGAFAPGVKGIVGGRHDVQRKGVRFAVVQGSYVFELLGTTSTP
jgi:hypothetical protein